jgi:hypothetical protein
MMATLHGGLFACSEARENPGLSGGELCVISKTWTIMAFFAASAGISGNNHIGG